MVVWDFFHQQYHIRMILSPMSSMLTKPLYKKNKKRQKPLPNPDIFSFDSLRWWVGWSGLACQLQNAAPSYQSPIRLWERLPNHVAGTSSTPLGGPLQCMSQVHCLILHIYHLSPIGKGEIHQILRCHVRLHTIFNCIITKFY